MGVPTCLDAKKKARVLALAPTSGQQSAVVLTRGFYCSCNLGHLHQPLNVRARLSVGSSIMVMTSYLTGILPGTLAHMHKQKAHKRRQTPSSAMMKPTN
eukprot:scaffold101016_cov18-Tisochrysis_lutea.AAC.1